MKEILVELLTLLFQRDNKAIDDIVEKFDYEDNHFVRPPENIVKTVDTLFQMNQPEINCEFIHGEEHSKEIESNGLKLPEGTIELWFKFKDVKLKRRKIYRLGDYYLRLINTGFDKWIWKFYVKQYGVSYGAISEEFVLAQHPHISHGHACMAGMETGIKASITNYNFNGFLWRIRTFLSSWNYRSPHWDPESFELPHMAKHNMESLKDAFVLNANVDFSEYPIEYNRHRAIYQRPETVSASPLLLTSARKKAYEENPLPRTILHITSESRYLNDDMNIQNTGRMDKHMLYNLANWIKEYIEEDICLNKATVLSSILYSKLRNQIRDNDGIIATGNWTEANDLFMADIHNVTEVYTREYRNCIDTDYSNYSVGYKLWSATNRYNNPDTYQECLDLIKAINHLRDYLITLRNYCLDGGDAMTLGQIKSKVYQELDALINIKEEKWEDVPDFLRYVDAYRYETNNEAKILEDEIEKAIIDYEPLKEQLLDLVEEQKIIYYKEELRRLEKNGRTNKVQIENLNL